MLRDRPDCRKCKLYRDAIDVGVMGFGPQDAKVMVVSRMHNSQGYQDQIDRALADAGIPAHEVYFTAALKCRNFEESVGPKQIKACQEYLDEEIATVNPSHILTFGNEALRAATGKSGITKYRSKPLPRKDGATVIATVSPAAVHRNPGQSQSWYSDIKFFGAQARGKSGRLENPGIAIIDTKAKFEALKKLLRSTELLAYDIETVGFNEYSDDPKMVSLAGTCELTTASGERKVVTWALPLYHPKSPFRKSWKTALKQLAPIIRDIPKQTGHNLKFDARWLRRFGVEAQATFDTIIAVHLLDENALKGLKPQVTARFGVADWSVDTKNLLTTPILEVLKYNALDTWYQYNLYLETKQELLENPRLLRLFKLLLMPVYELFIEAERRGVWIDRERLATNTKIALDMRAELEQQLSQWIPEPGTGNWPRKKNKAQTPMPVNFNASNWLRWWLFEHLELPVLERGKAKEDDEGYALPGAPSVKEAVMLELKGMHPAVEILLERVKWQKYATAFFPAYNELADENDRIHSTFKLTGTVTGRLSSGKEDAEKVSGRVDNRGVNLQQVPRDPFIRGLFGAQPGFTFVEVDFSQVELRVVAFLSRDRTMLRLYQTGQDIHRATASWVMGIPASQVTKEDRKKAKAVNFGFVYGMGAKKFVMTAFEKYEMVFTLDEATAIRRSFFQQFRGLQPWHQRQRRIVAENGRVVSPFGRMRRLPDIYSEDQGVRSEAERQAINSPVQSFASDMNLLAMLETSRAFNRAGVEGYILGTVHDATLFEIRTEHLREALPILKTTFENLPLKRRFGVTLDVPIVADIKVGTHWGDARELEPEEIFDFKGM